MQTLAIISCVPLLKRSFLANDVHFLKSLFIVCALTNKFSYTIVYISGFSPKLYWFLFYRMILAIYLWKDCVRESAKWRKCIEWLYWLIYRFLTCSRRKIIIWNEDWRRWRIWWKISKKNWQIKKISSLMKNKVNWITHVMIDLIDWNLRPVSNSHMGGWKSITVNADWHLKKKLSVQCFSCTLIGTWYHFTLHRFIGKQKIRSSIPFFFLSP